MDQGIGGRLELRGEEPAVAVREFARLLIHAEALGSARGEHDLRAEETHELAALDGKTVGHGHHQRITLRRADERETDARVAARRLDDGLPRFEFTASARLPR